MAIYKEVVVDSLSDSNVTCLKHKTADCKTCLAEISDDFGPVHIPLKVVLEELYKSGQPYSVVYISDISNNLSKIHDHFTKEIDLNNLGFTLTLCLAQGFGRLQGTYTHAFIDKDISDPEVILATIKTVPDAVFGFVQPTKQVVL
jgi:hypothetical protein